MSSQLDRAVWLLLLRSDLWSRLDSESHDDLAAQPGPYDLFFTCIERSLMEHGTVTSSALLEDLRTVAAEHPHGPATLDRITRLLPPEAGTDLAREFHLVLQRLRLKGIEAELEALFQSGTLSPQDQQRSLQLMNDRARLKAALAQAPVPAA